MGVHPRVQDFNQRSDGTIKLVTDEENVWVIQ